MVVHTKSLANLLFFYHAKNGKKKKKNLLQKEQLILGFTIHSNLKNEIRGEITLISS